MKYYKRSGYRSVNNAVDTYYYVCKLQNVVTNIPIARTYSEVFAPNILNVYSELRKNLDF